MCEEIMSNCNDKSEIIFDPDIDNTTDSTSQTDTLDKTFTEDSTDYDPPNDVTDSSNDSDGDGTDDDADNPAKGVIDGICFMETSKIVQLLTGSEVVLDQIPGGKKEFFVVNNEKTNKQKGMGRGKALFQMIVGCESPKLVAARVHITFWKITGT